MPVSGLVGECRSGKGREEGWVRKRPTGERASQLANGAWPDQVLRVQWKGGVQSRPGTRDRGAWSITRWRFAMGEVEGGPLKNWGGHKVALKEGGGVRVLQLGLPICQDGPKVGPKERQGIEQTQHAREKGLERQGR